MSVASQYAAAHWPDEVIVLGRRLQPYCIGHALLLHSLGNGFVTPGKTGGVGDLVAALYVCSRSWPNAKRGLNSCRVRWLLKRWARQLNRPKAAPAVLSAELALGKYILTAWDGPRTWENTSGQDSRPGAPALAILKVSLRAILGASEEEALSTPIRQAVFDISAWSEQQKAIQWLSDGELWAIEYAQEVTRN